MGIAIGDISGKGVPAAILMSNLQAALRVSADSKRSTDDVVRQVNIHITRTTSPEKFATFFYSVLNTETLELEYTNAGHNYPVLLRGARNSELLTEGGMILGVLENAEYSTKKIKLNPGDLLALYTDGITEATNPAEDQFGEDRLLETLQSVSHGSAQDILHQVLDNVINFTKGCLQSDDLTIVILKVK